MQIDIHAHVVERDYLEALRVRAGLEIQRAGDKTLLRKDGHTVAWSTESMFDPSQRLRDMDAIGVDIQVLSLSTPNVYAWSGEEQIRICRQSNDTTAAMVAARPDRFRWFASLPAEDAEASLDELDRLRGAPGLVGIILGSNIAGLPLNDDRFEALWARLDRESWPIFIHPMFPANNSGLEQFELPLRLGFPFDTTIAASRLIYGGVLERHERLTFILAHTGGTLLTLSERLDNGYRLFPECREFITRPPSTFLRRFYYDTASFFAPALMMAHAAVGADRLMLGTDYPFIGANTDHVLALDLPPDEKALILGGNAARLLKIEDTA